MIDIKSIMQENNNVLVKMLDQCVADIKKASDISISAIKNGNKIIWCGNGGSAADAQHMAAELMGGLISHDREAIPSLALTTNTSFITAWSNDTDYSYIFSRQIEGLGNSGDVLIAISTSGNSTNIINAIKSAIEKRMKVIVLTGKTAGKMKNLGDVRICIPSSNTQRIQEGHLLVEHILCELAEASVLTIINQA
ncbi:MAG: SIS domain-containing protein [Candidatus Marinimicrobia bacterium]|nr:SIS domain-containing protein [Candidatus Neomarinimicrobiota bacterium]